MNKFLIYNAVFILLFLLPVSAESATTDSVDDYIKKLKNYTAENNQKKIKSTIDYLEEVASTEAYFKLGKFYEKMPTRFKLPIPNYKKSFTYYNRAIKLSNDIINDNKWKNRAKHSLAKLIINGDVEGEIENALKILKEAAKKKNNSAAMTLAKFYETGMDNGKFLDYKKAEKWYRYALHFQDGRGAISLALLYKNGFIEGGEEKALNMSALGISILLKEANQGDIDSAFHLGKIYRDGLLVKQNRMKALEWFEKSANGGYAPAMKEAAEILLNKSGIKNRKKAGEYILNAAENGLVEAAVDLGRSLSNYKYNYALSDEVKIFWLENAAAIGDSDAIYILATYYFKQKKYAKALPFLEAALKEGDAVAAAMLYHLYENGLSVGVDEARAKKYFEIVKNEISKNIPQEQKYKITKIMLKMSGEKDSFFMKVMKGFASNGSNDAIGFLIDLYLNKEPKDYKSALPWLEKSASLGNISSILKLSKIYLDGIEVEVDKVKSSQLIEKAIKFVNLSDAKSLYQIAQAYKGGVIEGGRKEFMNWMIKSEKAGGSLAKVEIAKVLALGAKIDGYQKEDAITLLKDATSAGSVPAVLDLAFAYTSGIVTEINYHKALKYFKDATANKTIGAARQVAILYIAGLGTKPDNNKAEKYLLIATNENDVDAMLDLANFYRYIKNKEDNNKYIKWLKEASKLGNSDADYYLGIAYRDGFAVSNNEVESKKYFKKAAKNEHHLARMEVKKMDKNYGSH